MSFIDELEKLLKEKNDFFGLTDHDQTIYLTLLEHGPIRASEIGDITKIPKVSIYQVLNRLEKKGFIISEPTSRGARYDGVHPQKVIAHLKSLLEKQHNEERKTLEDISSLITQIDFNKDQRSTTQAKANETVWLINSEALIKQYVDELLKSASNSIIVLLPLIEVSRFREIIGLLEDRMESSKDEINLVLSWEITEETEIEHSRIREKLKELGANIYEWGLIEVPFQGFLIDHREGMIILKSGWETTPSFNIALWIRHPAYILAFENLIKNLNDLIALRKVT
ncbi:MAG: TrmB family transcriptional regulator [Candidatus Helarchaeota archaeon]